MEAILGETARQVVARLKAGEIAPGELIDILAAHVAATDGAVNALPTLCFDRARAAGARPDTPLAGLPVPIKDLTEVAGVRTTFGSPIYADHVPAASDLLVERLEAAGAAIFAKSNTPEFGAGAQTFNPVFGVTRNPWDTRLTTAGSSGGAAAALATGMAWIAHGSDMGGSLRNPASFCGVVGLRPTPGRVAATPGARLMDGLSVEGPMARNVGDVGLMLDAMVGRDPRDPRAWPAEGSFRAAAEEPRPPARVGFAAGLGFMPVDPEVAAVTEAAAARFGEGGAVVTADCPDLSATHAVFRVFRGLAFACGRESDYRLHRDRLKPDVVWNVEEGHRLTVPDIVEAEAGRRAMFRNVLAFFETHDLLCSAATVVPPYPVTERCVWGVGAHRFATYIDWVGVASAISLVACPALSLPCGFTRSGLPVGLQIVAPPGEEARLLSHAAWLEAALGLDLAPIAPRVRHAGGPMLTPA